MNENKKQTTREEALREIVRHVLAEYEAKIGTITERHSTEIKERDEDDEDEDDDLPF